MGQQICNSFIYFFWSLTSPVTIKFLFLSKEIKAAPRVNRSVFGRYNSILSVRDLQWVRPAFQYSLPFSLLPFFSGRLNPGKLMEKMNCILLTCKPVEKLCAGHSSCGSKGHVLSPARGKFFNMENFYGLASHHFLSVPIISNIQGILHQISSSISGTFWG